MFPNLLPGSGHIWPPFRAQWREVDTVQERPQELALEGGRDWDLLI